MRIVKHGTEMFSFFVGQPEKTHHQLCLHLEREPWIGIIEPSSDVRNAF
jgi:hypothetical protein